MADKSPSILPSLWSDNPFADLRKEMDQVVENFFGKNKLLSASEGEGFLAPSIDVVGLYASPAKWRLRGRAGWSKGGFSANAFINHIGGYTNQTVLPAARVSSWTTVDTSLSQRFGGDDSSDRTLTLSLSIQNLFDRDPPFIEVQSSTSALGYDPEKANPYGRTVAIQAVVRW